MTPRFDHVSDNKRVGGDEYRCSRDNATEGEHPTYAELADAKLTADLLAQGLVLVEGIGIVRRPTTGRLIVSVRDAHGSPMVAVVKDGPGAHDEAFARLMTKATVR